MTKLQIAPINFAEHQTRTVLRDIVSRHLPDRDPRLSAPAFDHTAGQAGVTPCALLVDDLMGVFRCLTDRLNDTYNLQVEQALREPPKPLLVAVCPHCLATRPVRRL